MNLAKPSVHRPPTIAIEKKPTARNEPIVASTNPARNPRRSSPSAFFFAAGMHKPFLRHRRNRRCRGYLLPLAAASALDIGPGFTDLRAAARILDVSRGSDAALAFAAGLAAALPVDDFDAAAAGFAFGLSAALPEDALPIAPRRAFPRPTFPLASCPQAPWLTRPPTPHLLQRPRYRPTLRYRRTRRYRRRSAQPPECPLRSYHRVFRQAWQPWALQQVSKASQRRCRRLRHRRRDRQQGCRRPTSFSCQPWFSVPRIGREPNEVSKKIPAFVGQSPFPGQLPSHQASNSPHLNTRESDVNPLFVSGYPCRPAIQRDIVIFFTN